MPGEPRPSWVRPARPPTHPGTGSTRCHCRPPWRLSSSARRLWHEAFDESPAWKLYLPGDLRTAGRTPHFFPFGAPPQQKSDPLRKKLMKPVLAGNLEDLHENAENPPELECQRSAPQCAVHYEIEDLHVETGVSMICSTLDAAEFCSGRKPCRRRSPPQRTEMSTNCLT